MILTECISYDHLNLILNGTNKRLIKIEPSIKKNRYKVISDNGWNGLVGVNNDETYFVWSL